MESPPEFTAVPRCAADAVFAARALRVLAWGLLFPQELFAKVADGRGVKAAYRGADTRRSADQGVAQRRALFRCAQRRADKSSPDGIEVVRSHAQATAT
jgi:hypothetical protein